MNASRTIGLTMLLTIVWMTFAFNLVSFVRASPPPRANVVPGNGLGPAPTATMLANADLSLPFVTKEDFERKLEEYRSQQFTLAVLAALFGLGTVVTGTVLEESWMFGVLCLLVGPIRAIGCRYGQQSWE